MLCKANSFTAIICENMISSHVKISVTSYLLSSSKIAREYSATFGYFRKSSDIFGNVRKMIENVRVNFDFAVCRFSVTCNYYAQIALSFSKEKGKNKEMVLNNKQNNRY